MTHPTTPTTGTLTIAYRCDGFQDPLNNKGHQVKDEEDDSGEKNDIQNGPSVFEGGSTVPVKFRFLDANNAILNATTAPLWLTSQKGSALNKPVDESLFADPVDTGTAYSLNGNTYKFNWKTKSIQTGFWYRIFAKLGNGQLCSVTVGLK